MYPQIGELFACPTLEPTIFSPPPRTCPYARIFGGDYPEQPGWVWRGWLAGFSSLMDLPLGAGKPPWCFRQRLQPLR